MSYTPAIHNRVALWSLMVRRRSEFDVLLPTHQPRWLVVRTIHGRILSCSFLPPGTHLLREFVASIMSHIDDGWAIGEFSSHSGFYIASKLGERLEVMISASDPNVPARPMYRV